MSRTSEPTWLRERRERAAGHELALPDQKQRGWEFTDLSSLDLASYAPAGDGDPSVATDAARVLIPVDGGSELLQVDGSPSSNFDAPAANGRPTTPAVLPLDAAAERFADLVGEQTPTGSSLRLGAGGDGRRRVGALETHRGVGPEPVEDELHGVGVEDTKADVDAVDGVARPCALEVGIVGEELLDLSL